MATGTGNKIIGKLQEILSKESAYYTKKEVNLRRISSGKKTMPVVRSVDRGLFGDISGPHALDLRSYLRIIVPEAFHTSIPRCDVFCLVRGEENEALRYAKNKGYSKAIILTNRSAKKKFERFFAAYDEDDQRVLFGICNIASQQRLAHYHLLLRLLYGRKLENILIEVFYPDVFLPQFEKMLKRCKETQTVIVGYRGNAKIILRKRYRLVPDMDISDDYFSFSYYKKEKLLITGHAFGWIMEEIVKRIVYHTKAKNAYYVGNCGALTNLQVGDIFYPEELHDINHQKKGIKNIFVSLGTAPAPHLSVPTPFVETKAFILEKRGTYKTIDVELYDIVNSVMNAKRKIRFGCALLVSDRPNRKENTALVSKEIRFQKSLNCVLNEIIDDVWGNR